MKRSVIVGAALAAALVVAGCGSSTPGTPSVAGGDGSVSSSGPAGGSSELSTTSQAASTSSAMTTETSDTETTATETSDTETSDTETSDTETSTTDDSTSDSSEATTTTLSGGGESTVVWFTAFCSGVAPLGNQKSLDETSGMTVEAYRGQAVAYLSTAGATFTALPTLMAPVPAPEFENGEEFATTIVAAFGKVGPEVTALAEEVKTKSAKTVKELADYAQDAFDDIGDSIGNDFNFDFDEKTQDEIAAIPACSSIFG